MPKIRNGCDLKNFNLDEASAMATLIELMQKCEEDTKEMVSVGAAVRLAAWRKYKDDMEMLVQFIQRVIRHNRRNGWELERQGGLSLERIILDHTTELFTEEDRLVAKANLGLGSLR